METFRLQRRQKRGFLYLCDYITAWGAILGHASRDIQGFQKNYHQMKEVGAMSL